MRARVSLAAVLLILTACPDDAPDGDACRVEAEARLGDVTTLDTSDTLRMFIYSDGRAVHADEAPLGDAPVTDGVVDVVTNDTTPVVPMSGSWRPAF